MSLPFQESWNGKRVADLLVDNECLAAALTRAGRALLPTDDGTLETGDVLLISATLEGSLALRARLQPSQA